MKYLKIQNTSRRALVENRHHSRLLRFKWHANKNGSIKRSQSGRSISLANEIKMDYESLFDHRDRNPFNNRDGNLRPCTIRQNSCNRTKIKGCSSKYLGVHWKKENANWVAIIRFKDKGVHLGNYEKETSAAQAYNKAASFLFGEFASLNKVKPSIGWPMIKKPWLFQRSINRITFKLFTLKNEN